MNPEEDGFSVLKRHLFIKDIPIYADDVFGTDHSKGKKLFIYFLLKIEVPV